MMSGEEVQADDLLSRARAGDSRALADLFDLYKARLRYMVRLRLDRRLAGRLDASDVLQEAYLEADRRFADYLRDPSIPVFLWLRLVTGQKLTDLHRHHLGAKMRDAGMEVSLHRGALPQASSVSLAELLLGRLTSPTRAARRAEMQLRLQEVLNRMDPIDREVLVLRHFEELSNAEVAEALGLQKTATSNRYIRALKRLNRAMTDSPGLDEA
jgi:RNA polymerase sigma-70 factor (ECF subfamily)